MNINFFEEYPTKENLSKLSLVTWRAIIFIASSSIKEFEAIKSEYKKQYPHITFGWWPLITSSYWISGVSQPKHLDTIFSTILGQHHDTTSPILLDLELPLQRSLIVKNIIHLRKNKQRIKAFMKEAEKRGIQIYTAEYPTTSSFLYACLRFLGISPSWHYGKHIKIPMCYSSMIRKSYGENVWRRIQSFEKDFSMASNRRVAFGLGTIATGVLGNEPILSKEELARDLEWAKQSGIREVFIFRLGGLDNEYIEMLKEFVGNESLLNRS